MRCMLQQSDARQADVTLWIIRWQMATARVLHSRFLASIVIFYIPIMLGGVVLRHLCDYEVFTRGVAISLLWIAIAPFLIQDALRMVREFFDFHKHLFKDDSQWTRLKSVEIAQLQSPRYLIFGIPGAIGAAAIVLFIAYPTAPFPVQVWVAVSFFMLFFLSSMGFCGVFVLATLVRRLCESDIVFRPYHPDQFGGMADVGRFAVRGALYFSSGALVLPLAFELADDIGGGSGLLGFCLYGLTGIFVAAVISGFAAPMACIKAFASAEKERAILDSRECLDQLIDDFSESDNMEIGKALRVGVHYYMRHRDLLKLKDYPYDMRVILELTLSVAIPIGIALLDLFSR